ncbi:MAG: AAA family ATPase [Rhizobiaceae bacterium]|nr:AAA family ATPase [Rhizobiaceae bacterium]
MNRVKNRILHYLLARQQRVARNEAFERAAEAGILERDYIGENERSGTKWRISDDCVLDFKGDEDHDFELITKFMKRSSCRTHLSEIVIEAEMSSEFCEDINSEEADHMGALDTPTSTSLANSDVMQRAPSGGGIACQQDHVLSLVKRLTPSLKPAEVTTALSLAKAIDLESGMFEQLMSAMEKSNPIIMVQVPVFDFVRQFGLMLEDGLILPFFVSLSPIESEPSLSGHYNELIDARRRKSIACMNGKFARQKDFDDELRKSISKNVLTQIKPVIIADEEKSHLPDRILAVSDITLKGDGIDLELIADVLSICCNIPKVDSLSMMTKKDFNPSHLGIDDMAVAIRPGRSLARIVDTLIMLEADNALAFDDTNDADSSVGSSYLNGLGNSIKPSRPNKYVGFYDVIEPCNLACEEAGSSSCKNHLFVEGLSGYGDAQQWALDLKQDLDAWHSDEVDWSELSTRLLLSGPPGTGKTTYAKALCNSLQIPLISTSVARWLEASHLGDVLAAISATFKYANAISPCILFIDEIDNIGSRNGGASGGANSGNGHKNDDYWASLINRLLELLDGAAKTDGIVILGATNRPEKIDPALLRSGRLEKHIIIPPPDAEALIGIIAHHLGTDLDAIVKEGSEASKGLIVRSMNDLPDRTHTNSAINNACSNIHVTNSTIHKNADAGHRTTRNGATHD